MPATVAYSAQGTQLQVMIGASPGGDYTDIDQIKGLTGPTNNWDIADITTLSSPSNAKEKKPLMRDPGQVTFDLVYDPANTAHEYLRSQNAEDALPLDYWKIILPTDAGSQELLFAAYVTKFEIKNQSAQVGMVSVELTLTGDIGFNA